MAENGEKRERRYIEKTYLGNDTMERTTGIPKATLTGCELSKVAGRSRDNVVEEFEY